MRVLTFQTFSATDFSKVFPLPFSYLSISFSLSLSLTQLGSLPHVIEQTPRLSAPRDVKKTLCLSGNRVKKQCKFSDSSPDSTLLSASPSQAVALLTQSQHRRLTDRSDSNIV